MKTYVYDNNYYCSTSCDYDFRSKDSTLTIYYTGDEVVIPSVRCSRIPSFSGCGDSSKLGMSPSDYNFSMSLAGNFVGFTILFFLVMLTTLVLRK